MVLEPPVDRIVEAGESGRDGEGERHARREESMLNFAANATKGHVRP
jgi:hypothetical protein